MDALEELDRARGVLAGLAIGDALGRPVEGLSPQEIRQRYGSIEDFLSEKPGGSDDTEYAIATALALIKHGRGTNSADFAQFWRENICPQHEDFLGAGFSEMLAIANLIDGLQPPQSGIHTHSWSDGLAMRVAPCGIVGRGNLSLTQALSIADGEVSHAGEGVHAGVAVAIAISLAMAGEGVDHIFAKVLETIERDSWTWRSLEKVSKIMEQKESTSRDDLILTLVDALATHEYAFADLAPEAVALAFSALLFGEGDFASTLLFAVNLGRDADTIAAMAGAMVGGIVGHSKIPTQWSGNLLPVEGTCLAFTRGMNPVDLAEGLLAL